MQRLVGGVYSSSSSLLLIICTTAATKRPKEKKDWVARIFFFIFFFLSESRGPQALDKESHTLVPQSSLLFANNSSTKDNTTMVVT